MPEPNGDSLNTASAPAASATATTDTSVDTSSPQYLVNLISSTPLEALSERISALAIDNIARIAAHPALSHYTVILLYDEQDSIQPYHANRIYQAASEGAAEKDVLLIVHSNGGSIEPAYLLSKTCKRLAKDRFVVVVPRRAKSAATLIALGADEIHMGLMSELGPIDPQIGDIRSGVFPALALGNALEELGRLCSEYPKAVPMLADYLSKNLDLRVLGYFTRVGMSASQYAIRLLGDKKLPPNWAPAQLADHFVNYYKDHGFVIDIEEALSLLGEDIVKANTPEYRVANEIYGFLDFLNFLLATLRQSTLDYVGSIAQGPNIRPRLA